MRIAAAVGKVDMTGLLGGIFPCRQVIYADRINGITAEDCILIIGEGAQLFGDISVAAAVLDSDSGVSALSLRGTPVITCGMSGKNTISITSRTEDSLTLSLNRTITAENGIYEPLELPVKLIQGARDFDYMAAFALSLLCGAI